MKSASSNTNRQVARVAGIGDDHDVLRAAGAERIFKEKVTGKTRQRPELDRLLDHLRAEDVVVITKYDRLARSLKDLIESGRSAYRNSGRPSTTRRRMTSTNLWRTRCCGFGSSVTWPTAS